MIESYSSDLSNQHFQAKDFLRFEEHLIIIWISGRRKTAKLVKDISGLALLLVKIFHLYRKWIKPDSKLMAIFDKTKSL